VLVNSAGFGFKPALEVAEQDGTRSPTSRQGRFFLRATDAPLMIERGSARSST
jgi:hypothetical protein